MEPSAPKLITVGVIATEVGTTVDRVRRVLQTRPHIRPRAFAGNVRLFDRRAIAMVRHEINAIDARKGTNPHLKTDHVKKRRQTEPERTPDDQQ